MTDKIKKLADDWLHKKPNKAKFDISSVSSL